MLPVEITSLATLKEQELNLGDVLFLREDPPRAGIVVGAASTSISTRFVICQGSQETHGVLLRVLSDAEPVEHVRLTNSASLRIRLLGAAKSPDRHEQAVGLLCADAVGCFVACGTIWPTDPVQYVSLSEWRVVGVDTANHVLHGGRAWFSRWQIVRVDEFGNETILFDIARAA